MQSVPGNVRGVVLGLAARCLGSIEHKNEDDPSIVEGRSLSGALCVCFDSESLGFAGALSQVFRRVSTQTLSWTMHFMAHFLSVCYMYVYMYCHLYVLPSLYFRSYLKFFINTWHVLQPKRNKTSIFL